MREITQTWLDLFLGFRIALDLRKMFIGLLALLSIALVGGVVLLLLMRGMVDRQNQLAQVARTNEESRRKTDYDNAVAGLKKAAVNREAFPQMIGALEAKDSLTPDEVEQLGQLRDALDGLNRNYGTIQAGVTRRRVAYYVTLAAIRPADCVRLYAVEAFGLDAAPADNVEIKSLGDDAAVAEYFEDVSSYVGAPLPLDLRTTDASTIGGFIARADANRHLDRDPVTRDESVMLDPRGQSLISIIWNAVTDAGGVYAVADGGAVHVLAATARLTLADLGLWHYQHPTTGTPHQPSATSVGGWLFYGLAGLILWWFLCRQAAAISRIAAIEVARDVRIEYGKATAFARQRARSLFLTPVLVDALLLGIFLLIALWGVVVVIPWGIGALLGIITVPAVLFGGFVMALLVIGGTFGFPLMIPAIAVEGTDSFDSLSRAFSFVFTRPWYYLWCSIVGTVYGLISFAFVLGFTLLMLALAFVPARWAAGGQLDRLLSFVIPHDGVYSCMTFGAERIPDVGIGTILAQDGIAGMAFAFLMLLVLLFVVGMAVSYAVSYTFTMFTLIYFRLRHKVDGTDVTEIFYDEDDDLWMAPPPELDQAVADTAGPATPDAT